MSMEEYSNKYKPKKKNYLKPFMPIIGIIILAIAAGMGYITSEPLLRLLQDNVPGVPFSQEMQLVVAGTVFLVIILAFGLIYSAFQPGMPKGVSESDLDREKRDREKEILAAKRRKKEMQAKMRQRNQGK